MESSRISPKSEQETVIEVFKFINIDHPDHAYLYKNTTPKMSATDEILRLFKTVSFAAQDKKERKKLERKQKKLERKQKKLERNNKNQLKPDDQVKESTKPDDQVKESTKPDNNQYPVIERIYEYIPDEVKEVCPLILESEKTMIESSGDIDNYLFFKYMIDATLAMFKSCSLKIENLDSEDELFNKKEFFIKVIASEETLLKHARLMNYELKVKKRPDWTHDFQQNSVYIPISIINKFEYNNVFVNYDQYGREVESGSVLTFNDKYIIINSILAKSIDLSVLASHGIMLGRFVLHQQEPINELKEEWAALMSFMKPLPSDHIKTYYSEQIAFYFNFLHLLKNFMKFLAVFGLIIYAFRIYNHYVSQSPHIIVVYQIYCVTLTIWSLAFNKVFERKEKMLAWAWGTLDFSGEKIQRQEFKGEYLKDEASGQMKIINSHRFVYFLIRIASLGGSICFMLLGLLCNAGIPGLFSWLTGVEMASEDYAQSKGYQLLGGILIGIQINVFNISYNIIARKLTNIENHETNQEHNNSLILKLFIFRFINSYLNLFYIAFLKEKEKCLGHSCMSELGYRLMVIFSTSLVFNFIEIGLPWIKYYFRMKKTYGTFKLNQSTNHQYARIEHEYMLEPYDNTINDYMELCTMFGYIALFGTSHHLVGVLALIALHLESRIDALKLCTILKRPEPYKTNSIGIWKKLFLFVSLCGIFTNIGISIFTSGLMHQFEDVIKGQLFIFVENSLLLVAVIILGMIPTCPEIVSQAIIWGRRIAKEFKFGRTDFRNSSWKNLRLGKKSEFDFDFVRKRARTIQTDN